jgi:hypothetical protein
VFLLLSCQQEGERNDHFDEEVNECLQASRSLLLEEARTFDIKALITRKSGQAFGQFEVRLKWRVTRFV